VTWRCVQYQGVPWWCGYRFCSVKDRAL